MKTFTVSIAVCKECRRGLKLLNWQVFQEGLVLEVPGEECWICQGRARNARVQASRDSSVLTAGAKEWSGVRESTDWREK